MSVVPRPRSSTERATVRVMVPAGAALAGVLPAAEDLLLALAGARPSGSQRSGSQRSGSQRSGSQRSGSQRSGSMPSLLADRVALAAFYRVWDALDQQLRPYGYYSSSALHPADSPRAHCVRLPESDLTVLTEAADALAQPTGELARALHGLEHADRDALGRLLAVLGRRRQPVTSLSDSGP